MVRGIRGTYGGEASAPKGDIWGAGWGKGFSMGQEKDWMVRLEEDMTELA